MNACDHGHTTASEVRLLPTGGGGNVIICQRHHATEIKFRKERIAEGVPSDLPKWESLKVYDGSTPENNMHQLAYANGRDTADTQWDYQGVEIFTKQQLVFAA